MRELDRLDIIHQLAQEYGMEGRPEKEKSHFDPSTGTLFIGSRVYKSVDLDNARRFFEENLKRARERSDASAGYYEIGCMAVERLMEESTSNGGRLVVKEDS